MSAAYIFVSHERICMCDSPNFPNVHNTLAIRMSGHWVKTVATTPEHRKPNNTNEAYTKLYCFFFHQQCSSCFCRCYCFSGSEKLWHGGNTERLKYERLHKWWDSNRTKSQTFCFHTITLKGKISYAAAASLLLIQWRRRRLSDSIFFSALLLVCVCMCFGSRKNLRRKLDESCRHAWKMGCFCFGCWTETKQKIKKNHMKANYKNQDKLLPFSVIFTENICNILFFLRLLLLMREKKNDYNVCIYNVAVYLGFN